MIRFALRCGQDHGFEAWFKDGQTFERQAEAGDVACPVCGDRAVRKAMMAPAVVRSGSRSRAEPTQAPEQVPAPAPQATPDHVKAAVMVAMLRQVREHVEKNFENVGERFSEEARRMHHGETRTRDIFGQATLEEARELHEEGIPVRPLPDLPKLDG